MSEYKPTDKTNFNAIAKVAAAGLLFLIGINALFFNKKHLHSPLDEVHFTQSSLLYFTNIRSYYYNKTEDTLSGFNLYQHRKFRSLLDPGDLDILLIVNPKLQMAYLYPDLKEFKDSMQSACIVIAEDTITLFPANAAGLKQEFAKLNSYIESGQDSISLIINGQVINKNMYTNIKARKQLSQMIFDYMKLTSGK
ncbi:MAG: hypothetical protein ACK4KT_00860 [Thermaurantimonas sp.]